MSCRTIASLVPRVRGRARRHYDVRLAEMDELEHPVMSNVQYPELRDQVLTALKALADPRHQRTRWGVEEPGVDYYDDLMLNVHILYDDCKVLPDPSTTVGAVIVEAEVPLLRALQDALGPLLDEFGGSPDSTYMCDPRWPGVIATARTALDAMNSD